MMKLFTLLLLFLSLAAFAENAPSPRFVRNDGQWDAEVLYRAAVPGGFVFLQKNSLRYVFYHTGDIARFHHGAAKDEPAARQSLAPKNDKPTDVIRAHGFEITFVGAQPGVTLQADGEKIERRNFFLDDDPAHWASDVPAFSEVRYKNLYPGVDLRLFAQNGTFKYEFLVAAQADPNQIKMQYSGMSRMSAENGFLFTETTVNKTTEAPPYSYQTDKAGVRREVPSAFVLRDNTVTFSLPKGFDRRLPLVIDPVLVFSTYSGSFTDNWGFTATYDKDGHLYSGGIEFGNRFPATVGAFQTRFSGATDVAILKYAPNGKTLVYATYLGGSQAEAPHSLIVNDAGELIVMGTTSSLNFPTTVGAFDRTYNGGTRTGPVGVDFVNGSDLFVAKLNAAGSALVGSTYVGGSLNDGISNQTNQAVFNYGDEFRGEVYIDQQGNIYFASTTLSRNFPIAGNASQNALNGLEDAVVCQLNPTLTALTWSSYLGGSGFDAARGIRVAPSGNVYVTGGTTSRNLPTTAGVVRPASNGSEDGFVARFQNQRLSRLSYLGTDRADQAYLIDLDPDENVYVLGLTFGQYPISQGVYNNPRSGQFIHAMDANLSRTLFSTTVGSGRQQPDISPTAFMRSNCGFLYFSGWGGDINNRRGIEGSSTTGLPTANAVDSTRLIRSTTNGDDYYLAILDQGASQLLYGAFFGTTRGDNHVDGGTSRFSPDGTIYHVACACADNSSFPTTAGVVSNLNNGIKEPEDGDPSPGCNNAAFKINLDALDAEFDLVPDSCGVPAQVRVTNRSQGGKRFEWIVNGQVRSSSAGQAVLTLSQPGEYTVTLKAYDPLTCKKVDSVSRKITVRDLVFKINKDTTLCTGQQVQLKAEGGVRYEWSPARGMDNPTSPTPTVSPTQTTSYTVRITTADGCVKALSTTVRINEFEPDFDIALTSECGKPVRLKLSAVGEPGRTEWEVVDGSGVTRRVSDTLSLDKAGQYEIVLRAFRGACQERVSKSIRVDDPKPPVNVITPNPPNTRFETYKQGWKVEIYNQWGRAVYLNDTYQNDWTAAGVDNGVYYYRLTSPDGLSCKGWIHVMR
ncbi:MAG: gliding motility-associated C-terminal domain-containing protein [Cytophagales bacterium]|nr:gliding motility-associated C-terminal domain-containing protein [Cytophagales bacterium]